MPHVAKWGANGREMVTFGHAVARCGLILSKDGATGLNNASKCFVGLWKAIKSTNIFKCWSQKLGKNKVVPMGKPGGQNVSTPHGSSSNLSSPPSGHIEHVFFVLCVCVCGN